MYQQKYLFVPHTSAAQDRGCIRSNCSIENGILVQAADLYTQEQGYGFITEKNMEQQPALMLPELNGGFMPVPWYRLLDFSQMAPTDGADAVRQIPLRFKCNVPSEGSYRIKVTLHPQKEISDLRIFTGRRCLGAYCEKLVPGEIFSRELYTEVCAIIPRGQEEVYDNLCIELSFSAAQFSYREIEELKELIKEIEIAIERIECPVLYIAGDSTVTDQSAEYPYAPQTSYAGWGQMLPYFIKGGMTVSNHSHSGLTTESFREEKHYEVSMRRFKAGDYLFFQFGHNDQKLQHLKAYEGYSANLERYINECRAKGGYPVLVTPVARNTWRGNDGSYNDLLKEYAKACLALGERLSVPVLDLHRLSMEFVIRLQKEKAKKYFYPSDYTHHNDFGAQQMAAMICREIERVCKNASSPAGTKHAIGVTPAESTGYEWLAAQIYDTPILWNEPKYMEPLQMPENFVCENLPEEFAEPDRPSDVLLRAEALDMVIRRAGFFITNVYNDFFHDIIGHEWYAGAVECGLENGIISQDMFADRQFCPLEPITLLDFITFLMMAYGSRKTLPQKLPCPYDAFVEESQQALVSAAYQLGVLAVDGTDSLDGQLTRHEGAGICRKLKIM